MKKIIYLTTFLLIITSCSSNKIKDQTPEEKKAELYYTQGTGELIKKDYLGALTNLLKAKELSPNDSKIRNNLGMAYYFREKMNLAEIELKEAISLDDKNSDAKINLGSIYFEKKKYKDARNLYEKVLSNLTYENQYRTYYNLAMLDLSEGDRKSAFENLNKSIKEKDDYCIANFKLGELYAEEYKFKEALHSFRQAGLGLCVSEPAPLYQQAITLLNLEKKKDAKIKFEEVISKFPDSKFQKMATNQIKRLAQNSDSEEDNISNNKQQTETISDSPRF